ncbi:MAG: C4-dicarboxylate ABC transporter permease [Deltaproteobacteria bacterium HGW-Deltaproteobacteria-15]|jgi:tripartite ATP-independent transporter DctM subunit|nr:MAG: C4-dicarboxylate ABC transporter permease [Deltaproteobacteria bacterium HGW-Deltaproteobacteria-15]
MSDIAVGIYGIIILLALFLTGLEMAYCMILVGFVGFTFLMSFGAASNLVVKDFFDTFTTYSYTVIPLFIMMGELAQNSNIAKRLYVGAQKWIGHIPGGLAMTTVLGATAFKAMCGSTLATVGTFSGLAIPEMDRYGYKKELSAGTVASVSTIGMILPPSTVLIIYGLQVEQSIGRLFLAGILPALMISLFFMFVIAGWVLLRPEIAPRAVKGTWKERIAAIPDGLVILVIFGIVIGGMITGFFSPTEAGTIGTVAVFILALTRREINSKMLVASFRGSLRTSIMTLMLIAGSSIFGHFLAITEIPMIAAEWTAALPVPKFFIMVVIIAVYLIGGSIMDDLAFMVLATPIFFPTVVNLGYDPIWFGILICMTLMIGGLIPPVAIYVFILGNITGLPFKTIYKGVIPFLSALVLALVIMFVFPDFAPWLPNLLMGR